MKTFDGGRCLVANDVIDQMIARAAYEVTGVTEVKGYDQEKGTLRLGYDRFIVTETDQGSLDTRITVKIALEESIVDVVREIQESVKQEIEMMLGLYCRRVDVTVI